MYQTEKEETTALARALRALSKALNHQPKPEPRASAVNETPQPLRR